MAAKTWTGGIGTWGNGLNWSPAGYAGAADDVAIVSAATISGNGSSASLTVAGPAGLSGIFATGALAVGTAATSGALTLSGGSLAATSASILFGPLQVTGSGTKLTVTGQLQMGGARTAPALSANSLVASGGGFAQLGGVSMNAGPGGNGITVADATSRVEVGTAGGTAAGTITVDAGRSVSGQGTLSAANGIVNAGTITAQGGMLAIGGGVTGAGLLQIGAGATLYLMTGVSLQNVAFTGAGAQLEIVPVGTNGLTETGVISGFVPGDTILYAGSFIVTGVTYRATGSNLGTLTLNNGASVLGTLNIAGNYTGYTFQVTPNSGFGTLISVVAPSTGGTAGGGSPGTDAFAWIGSSGGWAASANWQDSTTHVNGLAAPGSSNAVLLNGSTAVPLTVSGPGASSSLTAIGNTLLSGAFTTGAVTVGSAVAAGGLSLAAGASLTGSSGAVTYGTLAAAGAGARVALSGTLTLGGSRAAGTGNFVADALTLSAGAAAQLGGLAMPVSPGGNSVSVDATSSLEIGTVGSAALGKLTVDAGQVLQGSGLVVASGGIVNQGTVAAEGGMLQIGSGITGGGQLAIGGGATLSIYNGVSAQPVTFAGANATLQITQTASGGLTETGTMSGFAPGDTIVFASATPVSTVRYTPGAGTTGTLSLINGASVVGTLGVTGDFSHDWFQLAPNGSYGTAVTVVAKYPSPDPLFDSNWYLNTYPSIAAAGVDPYQDFMTNGWKEGRSPDAWFNTTYYLNQNPDVAAAGVNPLTHFEKYGWKEGRDPSALFSVSGYLRLNADVGASGLDPLLHYVVNGANEGRKVSAATPHSVGAGDPGVDYAYYYAQHPEIAAQGIDAATSYHTVGWKNGWNPDPYFDTNYYLSHNADVRAAGIDPLTHYETYGWHEGRLPSVAFNATAYLAANTDVAAAGVDPLVHYMQYGMHEHRIGFLPGQSTPPDPLVDTAYYAAQRGGSLFAAGTSGQSEATYDFNNSGWQQGLNPDAFFDVKYYLSHNPDVAAAHVNPLQHYEQYGWREGRNPSAQFSTAKYLAANADVKAAGVEPLQHYVQYGQFEGRAIFAV